MVNVGNDREIPDVFRGNLFTPNVGRETYAEP